MHLPATYEPTSFAVGVSRDGDHDGYAYVSMFWDGQFGTCVQVSLVGVHGIRIEGTNGRDVLQIDDDPFHGAPVGLPATILGGAGDDILFGGSADDVLIGGDGRDRARGFGGSDVIDAEAGIDFDPSASLGTDYFDRFQRGVVPYEAKFANDPLESDPADVLTGSAAWLEAVARATGQPWPPAPVEQGTAADAKGAPTTDQIAVAPPAVPANFTAAPHPFFAGANAKLWDDAGE